MRHLFVHFKCKNVDILILTYEPPFLFKSEKKTDEGLLKQKRECLRKYFLFGLNCECFLIRQLKHMFWVLKITVSMRPFFGVPTTCVLVENRKVIFKLRLGYAFILILHCMSMYQDIW